MNLDPLAYFGLSKNDTKVWNALLSLGVSKTGPIIKTTSIQSSRVYASLETLLSKGLVSYQVKNNVKYYRAESPQELLAEIDRKRNELAKLSKNIEAAPLPSQARNEVSVFEGRNGFRVAFAQFVQRLRPREEILIVGFWNQTARGKDLRKFLADLDESLKKKKCKARMLIDQRITDIMIRDRQYLPIYTIRYLPAEYFSPTAIQISEHEAMLSLWDGNPTNISLKNPVTVKSFRRNFEFLWSIAKEK